MLESSFARLGSAGGGIRGRGGERKGGKWEGGSWETRRKSNASVTSQLALCIELQRGCTFV